jgi:hypothetical protein
VPFQRGLSPETLVKQQADQAAARVPGLRDAVAAAEAIADGRCRRSALLFTRAICLVLAAVALLLFGGVPFSGLTTATVTKEADGADA